jgi:hypothetical protein
MNFVYASYDEEIYEGWSVSGGNFSVDDHVFKIGVNQPQYKVSVNAAGLGAIILYNNSCSELGNYSVCLKNISFLNHTGGTVDKDYYKALLEINQVLAFMSATKTVSKTSLLIGESAQVSVTILNSGSIPAKSIVYEENFDNFVISEVSECTVFGNKIRWGGTLGTDISKKCVFTLTAIEGGSVQTSGKIRYFNGRTTKEITTSATTISVADYPLKATTNITKNCIEINQNVTYNITLKNINPTYDMFLSVFTIDIPYGLKIIKRSLDMELLNNKYTWKGNVKGLESLNLFLILKGELEDNYALTEHAEYMVNNLRYSQDYVTYLNVSLEKPDIVFQKGNALYSDEKTHLKIMLKNPSSDYSFKNMEVQFSTDLPGGQGIKKTIPELKKNSYETIYETDFIAPDVQNETSYYLKIKGNYKSIYNQYLRFEKESTITIKPKTLKVTESAQNHTELTPEPTQHNITSQTTQTEVQQPEDTSILLSTREELVDRIKISKEFVMSAAFIALNIITLAFIIVGAIKLR